MAISVTFSNEAGTFTVAKNETVAYLIMEWRGIT
jgi:hypothetical protein